MDYDIAVDMVTLMMCRCIETQVGVRRSDDIDNLSFRRLNTPAHFVGYMLDNELWRFLEKVNSTSDPYRDILEMRRIRDYIFFQAKDGIRNLKVTGVQTCALPI